MNRKYKLTVWSSGLLILGIIIAVNILSGRFFGRLDISEGKLYTLSDYSRGVVSNLEDPITVKAYFSRNLGQYNNVRQYVKDKLADYRSYSHGQFNFEMINPDDNEELKQEAESFGIRPIQMQSLENDKMEVKLVFMGLVLIHGDKRELLPVVANTENLEYDITSAIKRLTMDKIPRVGILQGHGEPDLNEGLGNFQQVLSKNYEVTPVDLPSVSRIDGNLETLLLISPTEEFSDADKAKLDEYLNQGGRLGIFLNKVQADMQTQQGTLLRLNLDDLLQNWGIEVRDNLIMDMQSGVVQVRMGGNSIFSIIPVTMQYPFFPKVTNFNRELSISKDVESAQLFFVSSLDTSYAASAGVQVTPFAWSGSKTSAVTGRFNLGIKQKYLDSDFPDGVQIYGAVYTGSFTSKYSGSSVADSLGLTINPHSPETRVAVMGDGNFLQNTFLSQGQLANLELAQNLVDWLTQDEGLINIRSKAVTDRPLRELDPSMKAVVKWLNILGAPVILVLVGIFRWQAYRRRTKQEV